MHTLIQFCRTLHSSEIILFQHHLLERERQKILQSRFTNQTTLDPPRFASSIQSTPLPTPHTPFNTIIAPHRKVTTKAFTIIIVIGFECTALTQRRHHSYLHSMSRCSGATRRKTRQMCARWPVDGCGKNSYPISWGSARARNTIIEAAEQPAEHERDGNQTNMLRLVLTFLPVPD